MSIKAYIYVGENKIYEYFCSIDFELNQGFIIGSNDYKEYIEKNFFDEKIYKKECFKKEISINKDIFYIFYCKNNTNLRQLEDLILYINKIKYEIKFTYKDIFTIDEINNFLFFNVIFLKHDYNFKHDFILGKPFFKKYPIVFNVEGNVEKIGFYYNLFVEEEKENKNDINEYKFKYDFWKVISIILIFIGIIIIGLLIYIFLKNIFLNKKEKDK